MCSTQSKIMRSDVQENFISSKVLIFAIGIAFLLGKLLEIRRHVLDFRNQLIELASHFGLNFLRVGFEKHQHELMELHQLEILLVGQKSSSEVVHDGGHKLPGSVQHVASDDREDDETGQV